MDNTRLHLEPVTGLRSLTNATPLATMVGFATQVTMACIAYLLAFGGIFFSALAAFANPKTPTEFIVFLANAWVLVSLVAAVGHTMLAVMFVQRRRSTRVIVTVVSIVWLSVLLEWPMVWPIVAVQVGSAVALWLPTRKN